MGGKSKAVTVGYKTYLGEHMVLCHGPIDYVERIQVDERTAWGGQNTGGQINVQAEDLFGGESREGGVSGLVDIEMGGPTQGQNSYLVSVLGSDVPAYRGVVSAILRKCYLGNNPYLKKWNFRGSRIHVRQNDIEQWYDDYSEIVGIAPGDPTSTHSIDLDAITNGATSPSGGLANGVTISGLNASDILVIRPNLGGSYIAFSPWGIPNYTGSSNSGSGYRFKVIRNGDTGDTREWMTNSSNYDGYPAARAAFMAKYPNGVRTRGAASYTFYMEDTPVSDNSGGLSLTVDVYPGASIDMNPAHIIRECLTDPDWGMGYQDADIDADSFELAAETLLDEGLGMSLLWDKQITIEQFVQELVRHIDAALYVDRKTGKFVLKLIRADYEESGLLSLDESNVQKVTNPSKAAFGELINSVTVNYWDAATGKDASLTVQDTALVQMQGQVIGTTMQYPGFSYSIPAAMAAQRDLRALSIPFLTCTLYADASAKDLNIGDVFKFSWGRWQIAEMVMRVVSIAFGNGKTNLVRITCTQDVYSTPLSAVVVPNPGTGWVDPSSPPSPFVNSIAFEAPYLELVQTIGEAETNSALAGKNDVGFVGGSAPRSASAINGRLWTDSGEGYEDVGGFDFCPYAVLTSDINKVATVLAIADDQDLDQVTIGSWCQIDDELMRVDAIDTGAGTLTVGRGVLDTVPEAHSTGAGIFFWDEYSGYDPTEYVDGEEIEAKLQPISGAGTVSLSAITPKTIEIAGRPFRPYAPGDLRVNSESYVDSQYSGELTLTWAHRDRLQQTSGTLADHFDGDIGPEAGTVYRLQGYSNDVLVHTEDDIAGTEAIWTPVGAEGTTVRVEVHAKRDEIYSYQAPWHEFEYGNPPEDDYWLNTHLFIDATGQADGTAYANTEDRHAHNITYLNDATILASRFELDGSDALRIGVVNDPIWAPATKATFEMFAVSFDALSAQTIASLYNADSADNRSWRLWYDGTNLALSVYPSGTSSPSTTCQFAWVPALDGTEYDLAWSWDGTTICLYIDGTCVATAAFSGFWYQASSGSYLVLGGHYQGDSLLTSSCFDGRFRAARFTRGVARMSGAVSSTYTVPAFPLPFVQNEAVLDDPDWDKVMLLARVAASGVVYDASPFDWHMIPINNATGSLAVKPGDCDGSIYLDGVNDIYEIPDNRYVHPGSGDFTLEAQVRFEVISGDNKNIFSRYNSSNNTRTFHWSWYNSTTPDALQWATYTNGSSSNANVVSDSFTPTVGTFYNLAISRSGNDHRHFIDGVQSGATATQANTIYEGGSMPFWIGAIRSANSSAIDYDFGGYITELRLTKGLARYTAGYTAPTGKLPSLI